MIRPDTKLVRNRDFRRLWCGDAISLFGDSRLAARSQYWMLALMVGFTSLGLYLLSQGN